MDYIDQYVRPVDPEVADAITQEEKRQNNKLELIASENFVSRAVMAAQGGVMTNKYAEGYPGKRYYGGCEWVDVVEELARTRAKALLARNMLMFSPIPGLRPILPSILRLWNQGYCPGHEFKPWRAPDPWQQGQYIRKIF